jgi:hypothetical protein
MIGVVDRWLTNDVIDELRSAFNTDIIVIVRSGMDQSLHFNNDDGWLDE